MTANAFHTIAQIETSLWEAADQLRANSSLMATEYSMPVLSVIFAARYQPLSNRAASFLVSSAVNHPTIHRNICGE